MRSIEWTKRFWVKALAFTLATALVPVLCVCGAALICGYENSWWADETFDVYETDFARGAVLERLVTARDCYERFGAEIAEDVWFTDARYTNYRFAIRDAEGGVVFDNLTAGGVPLNITAGLADGGRIESGVAAELRAQDGIFWAVWAANLLHGVFAVALPLLIASALALLFLIVVLARVAGRRANVEGVVAGWQEKIPFDLYLAVVGAGGAGLLAILMECLDSGSMDDLPLLAAAGLGCVTALAALALALWMTLCARVKLGKWWRNTVVFQALRLGWRALRWCGRAIGAAVRALPLVWRTTLLLLILSAVEFFCIATLYRDVEVLATVWLLGKLLIVPAALYLTLMMRRLLSVGAALAAGDLDARADTRRMVWELRRHGENLNDISRGMQRAVEKQLRSERLKTELITNVSHDIKTPLTSIVNYVELLRRDTAGEHTAEYLEVLDRQSRRLKKLTEDLVEVSKASTGNLPVNASRRSVGELLTQALGEYSERLDKAGLTPVLTLPEREAYIWADGALTWRVIDNLFSNACKYALSGTRFYIDAAEADGRVRMSFKNVSRDELNVSADELLERFARGDAARGGEGSGLGLDIARSLTEAQGGAFRLSVDGDLFRVDVELPSAE